MSRTPGTECPGGELRSPAPAREKPAAIGTDGTRDNLARIRELERASRALEPDAAVRGRLRDAVAGHLERFLEELPARPTYQADKRPARKLLESPIGDEPRPIEELLALFDEAVTRPGILAAGPGHLGYIPGGGLFAASLGDVLAAITNEYAGVRFAGPGAVEMENQVLDWMASDVVGYPPGAAGNLASGGSIANLIAIVTAREAKGLRARDYERAVVYLTSHAHHCVAKSLRVVGLGECVQRVVPLDGRYRMVPEALDAAIREDRADGRIPWLVIGSAGTTDVGAIDPLVDIARVAGEHDLWYHVDAAYGGFFALVDSLRPKLAGMELSDSIVLDPHKGLFNPYGAGALLVRDGETLRAAHVHRASYMQDTFEEESPEARSPADLSPELTKHFRGARVWLPLMLHGVAPFRAALEEKHELARYFHREARALGFEVGPEPELSVATYRWLPERGDPDAFNRALIDEMHRDGRIFLSSTRIDGRFVLRLAVLVFRTHLETIDLTLEILREKVAKLEREGVPAG